MNDGKSLESYVQYVYQVLLNLRSEGVVVSKRALLQGKSGAMHEVDVYYEFTRAGLRHRVAMECKDLRRPVTKGDIQEFHSKLHDIGGVQGVVVSRNGYQEGAKLFGLHWDMLLLTAADLPALGTLMAEQLRAAALPDELSVGEPFWTIMAMERGENSGSYFAASQGADGPCVPLLLSKAQAQEMLAAARLDPELWAVRGLARPMLRVFILFQEMSQRRDGPLAAICIREPGSVQVARFLSFPVTPDELARDYYGEPLEALRPTRKGRTSQTSAC